MEKLKVKIIAILLIVILTALMIPANVFAANPNMQVVKAENGDYIIYVKEANGKFKFAISDQQGLEAESIELRYVNSVPDGEGNNVALIESSTQESIGDTAYIYIKTDTDNFTGEIDFSQAFDKEKMEQVEGTTNRIETELLTNLEERNEVIDGVQYKETVGGLKIVEQENASYEYVTVKLPDQKYSILKELADKLNTEYESKDMYSKIEFAKEFNTLYEELIDAATEQNIWKPVENMEIRQPIDAQKGDQYVVLLKKVSENEIEYDAKFLVSYREDEEEKIPGRIEKKVVQETAKLPITGDSFILFVVLAVIIIALIIVFIRMKKIQNKGKH